MAKYDTPLELWEKCDSEGGLASMLFGYGLNVDDLPKDAPGPIQRAVAKLNDCYFDFRTIQSWLEESTKGKT